ncbi:LysR family transcriptional regulator [Pseudomonas putida]|uniref:LysR family transcriptional regulator n=1 Tax=Pseudomonas putida TaxID=303 RepID=UPI00081920B6|nr:LysR family transcriptional regulator [Pseudomonas putida]OCT29987.1 LysR family transcriptional regulator [Pseudomonas putida]OCT31685.1 LysR family transcriptional regulator [Pseudomonas putida]OCT33928.1 LysR family transcriptional regulator [Pseudomonas putida]OCT40373.1 LysR family transcriptional regulator [Pseudomonas putida]
MITFADLELVTAISASGSLSEAARKLRVTTAALSMRLRKLEGELGLKLASRDARRLSLTEDGERLAEEGKRLLQSLEELSESMIGDDQQLQGVLRLAAPFGFGRLRLAPMLARFAKLHPKLKIELDLKETPWPDRNNFDAVIHIGSISDSSWTAQVLAANERWLCASPLYLQKHGMPDTPSDIASHRCICIRENDEHVTFWHLHKNAQTQSVRVLPAMTTNDGGVARRWAESDLGLVLRSQWDVAESVANGTLMRVLPDWQFDTAPILLLIPTKKNRSRKVQMLSSFLSASFKSTSPDAI